MLCGVISWLPSSITLLVMLKDMHLKWCEERDRAMRVIAEADTT
jgi:hypothetical protein